MIEVHINPEDVNKAVADAIIKSCIGKHVKDSIEKLLTKDWHMQSAIDKTIEAEVSKQIQAVIHEEFSAKIKEIVVSKTTDEVITRVMLRAWEKLA